MEEIIGKKADEETTNRSIVAGFSYEKMQTFIRTNY
jgi:hypothetical protein